MTNTLGLSGKAGSGKDTLANYLVQHHLFINMSLADEMKRFVKEVFGFSEQQLWGPSAFRNEPDPHDDPEYWEAYAHRIADVGPTWCKKVFPLNHPWHSGGAYDWLTQWFKKLQNGDYGPFSPRIVLQTIGTEWGRHLDSDVWVNVTLDNARKALTADFAYTKVDGLMPLTEALEKGFKLAISQPRGVVIPDCRFRNELLAVKNHNGVNIRVRRPGQALASVGIVGHPSEAEMDTIPDNAFDFILDAPEGIEMLHAYLRDWVPAILARLP